MIVASVLDLTFSWGSMAVALVAGVGLGLWFFGGLWWTVNRLPQARRPALLFAGSFFVRTAGVVAGFYFIAGGGLMPVAICMIGFIMTRMFLTRRLGTPVERGPAAA